MRVKVRGKVYDSVKQCAKALGVSPATVYCAVTRRTTETIGLGRDPKKKPSGGRPAKPVRIGAVEFPSMSEASRALGFNRRHVQQVLTIGKTESRARLLRAAMEYQARRDMAAAKERAKA